MTEDEKRIRDLIDKNMSVQLTDDQANRLVKDAGWQRYKVSDAELQALVDAERDAKQTSCPGKTVTCEAELQHVGTKDENGDYVVIDSYRVHCVCQGVGNVGQ